MKKIITFITMAVTGLFASCGDILDILPVSNNQAEKFFANEDEVYQGLAGVYARLGRFNTNEDLPMLHYFMLSENRSDNLYIATVPNAQRDQADLRRFMVQSSTGTINTTFNRFYSLISGANTLISIVPEETYPAAIAQARFLRAYAYFELARTWGDVPVVTEPIESKDAASYNRQPVTEVYAQVIRDLTYAIEKLPEIYTGADAGRANAWAARTLLAYVYVTMAGYPVNDGTAYQKAVDALSPIINNLGSRFAPTYPQIFSTGEENTWDLFSVQFTAGNAGLGSSMMGYQTGNSFTEWSSYTRQGQDARIDSLLLAPMRQANDPRALFPLVIDGYWNLKTPPDRPYTQDDVAKGDYTERPYLSIKYLVIDPDNAVVKAWNDSPLNHPILRVADAYLLYAEALVGTNKAADAKQWVDKVRIRSLQPALSADPTMADIFEERRKEFIFEGKRYFDLVRQGETVFVNTLKTFADYYELTTAYGGSYATTRDMLLPLPQSVMDIHKDWEQNPGY